MRTLGDARRDHPIPTMNKLISTCPYRKLKTDTKPGDMALTYVKFAGASRNAAFFSHRAGHSPC